MLSKRRAVAVAVAALAIIHVPSPARSNPAAVLPAACATGAGCVFVGAVLLGGTVYYIWQHQRTGRRYQVPAGASAIIDQENPRGWWPGERVPVAEFEACYRIASRYRKRLIRIDPQDTASGVLRYVCIFAPAQNPLED